MTLDQHHQPGPDAGGEPQSPAPVVVQPAAQSRLAALLHEYPDAKAAADAAAERLKAISDGIKLELGQAHPGADRLEVRGPGLPPMSLFKQTRMTFDSKRLKADAVEAAVKGDPSLAELYARYARQNEAFVLKALKSNGGDD